MEAIFIIQITPEQLQTKILKGVKIQIDELKKQSIFEKRLNKFLGILHLVIKILQLGHILIPYFSILL